MDKLELTERIRPALPELRTRWGVAAIFVFGSVAPGDQTPGSDVDLLIDLDRPLDLFEMAELSEWLSAKLHAPADLGTRQSLKPCLRAQVENEAVQVA